MSWDFTKGASKQDIVRQLTEIHSWEEQDNGFRNMVTTEAHKVVGRTLWAVKAHTRYDAGGNSKTSRYIMCYLLDNQRGFGWGFKDMDEAQQPYQYDCPVEFLDMAPAPAHTAEWRDKVRAEATRLAKARSLKVGDRVLLIDGCFVCGQPVSEAIVTSVRPRRATVELPGNPAWPVSLPKRLIQGIVSVP